MGQISKNARSGAVSHKFMCSCGGEVKMKTIFSSGRKKNYAECDKCKKQERRPTDFK